MNEPDKPRMLSAKAIITTKYHGPTDRRGSRISARLVGEWPGQSKPTCVFLPWDHALSSCANHEKVARYLVELRCWHDLPVVSAVTKTGWCFTVIDRTDEEVTLIQEARQVLDDILERANDRHASDLEKSEAKYLEAAREYLA